MGKGLRITNVNVGEECKDVKQLNGVKYIAAVRNVKLDSLVSLQNSLCDPEERMAITTMIR